jgi:FAD-linked sulfhydryl oxidase
MNRPDPKIWGPHFWFFIHSVAMTYPKTPNDVTKKKYYEFIQNLHLFLPEEKISSSFKNLLADYPITPYLDNRESFVRWVWFIHNKINEKLEKPQITLEQFYKEYNDVYKSTTTKTIEYYKFREKLSYLIVMLVLSSTIYYLYDK